MPRGCRLLDVQDAVKLTKQKMDEHVPEEVRWGRWCRTEAAAIGS